MGSTAGRADEQGYVILKADAGWTVNVIIDTCVLSTDEKRFYGDLREVLDVLEFAVSDTHIDLFQDPVALAVVHDAFLGTNATNGIGFLIETDNWQEANVLLQQMVRDLGALGYHYILGP